MRGLVLTAWAVFIAIVLTLVGLRFLALLAGANGDSDLVQELYRYSEFWVQPFFDMFSLENQGVDGGGTFEPASLLAFVVYLAIGAIVGGFLSGAFYQRLHPA